MSDFIRTTAINKLLNLKKRKKIVQGGTWAGKTFGIMAILIDFLCKNEGRVLTVVAESIPALKNGALKDFMDIMVKTNRFQPENYNGTDRKYSFPGGSVIHFDSYDTVGKAQAAGKRTDLYINEAPYIAFPIADALIGRTSGNIWIDFNPTTRFWVHDEIQPNPDADFIILKFPDNEALPESILTELNIKIEKAKTSDYWKNWCRVYIDGEIGNLEGVVFNDWKIIDAIPEDATYTGSGLDFGYSNDPTALVDRYTWNDKRIFDLALYQKGLSNSQIATSVKLKSNRRIYADSAEPKSIDEIRSYGVNIQPTVKGRDSINYGIQLLQESEFLITSRSMELIKELRNYIWKKDKTGNRMQSPIDNWNHAIDAMRYVEVRSKIKRIKVTSSSVL